MTNYHPPQYSTYHVLHAYAPLNDTSPVTHELFALYRTAWPVPPGIDIVWRFIAVDHVSADITYTTSGASYAEHFNQSVFALEHIQLGTIRLFIPDFFLRFAIMLEEELLS
jgi:hypothetical protein